MRRELVQKALHHNYPARIPMLYFNGHKEKSDIFLLMLFIIISKQMLESFLNGVFFGINWMGQWDKALIQ